LTPQSGPTQIVASWALDVRGAVKEVSFQDHFGNETRLLSVSGGSQLLEVVASGEVDVRNTAGVSGAHSGFAPLWLFERDTELTSTGPLVQEIADSISATDALEQLHGLSSTIRDKVAYVIGV